MIKSFKHKGLEDFYLTGSLKGIQAKHAEKLERLLTLLSIVKSKDDFSSPFLRFHRLKGDKKNLYAITVQANWRLTFEYDEKTCDIYILDYQDYH